MCDMRRTTKIGEKMRGDVRSGIPPESISSSSLVMTQSQDNIKSISFDEDFSKTKTINYAVSWDEVGPTLEFAPEDCVADPSWDVWSFGLIMGQLCLGQSMVLLPNFEKASDAHLKKLSQYNSESLDKIAVAARRVSGNKAAALLVKCLEPAPEDRPKSMNEILRDPYFDDISSI